MQAGRAVVVGAGRGVSVGEVVMGMMGWSRVALGLVVVGLAAGVGCDGSSGVGARADAGAGDEVGLDGAAADAEADSAAAEVDVEIGDDVGASPEDAAAPDADAGLPPEPPPECPELVEGLNVIQLGDGERRFWVRSPTAEVAAPAALFWFHGYSGPNPPEADAASESGNLDKLGLHPDADPGFPFVRVLLEDTNLQPLEGLDWDIRTDAPNVDVALFDVVVACVRAHRGVAPDGVFVAGFSAGATLANLIHSARPELVRAVYTASGLWLNEPRNEELAHRVTFDIEVVNWDWPALAPVPPGAAAVLLTHGGPNDNVPGSPNATPSNLTEAGRAAADMLVDSGRLVIECEHGGGHTLHPEVSAQLVLDFFAAHLGTGTSPWMTSSPTLPSSCTLRLP